MCCSNLFSGISHGNIDASIITQQKYVVSQSFFLSKHYLIKTGSWLQSCKMTGHGTQQLDKPYPVDGHLKFKEVS